MHLAFGIATNLLIGIGLLYVLVWILIFGGVGAVLSSSRDGSPLSGIGWGVLIGPVGWAVICARSRPTPTGIRPSAPRSTYVPPDTSEITSSSTSTMFDDDEELP
jgi:hypothetical protein